MSTDARITPCPTHGTGPIGRLDCAGCISHRAAVERHRHECEARSWLEMGYTTAEKISELRQKLAQKPAARSAEAIEKLIAEMRRQWPRMKKTGNEHAAAKQHY